MSSEVISFPQRKILKNYRSMTGHFPSIKTTVLSHLNHYWKKTTF